MRIAYFINQYPKVSHSFIRREILSLEKQGVEVSRFALRGWDAELVDAEDIDEQSKTRFILQDGLLNLFTFGFKAFLSLPLSFLSTIILAFKLGWHADRPLPLHLIYFAEACKLKNMMEGLNIDHIHAHFGTNSTEIVMLVHALGGPAFSFTVHGPEEFDKPGFLKLGEKIRSAKFVAAISSYGRSQLFRQIEQNQWHKVKEVHCGLEKAFYDVPVVVVPENNQLVCVGRLCEQKGQLLLIEAVRLLIEKGIDIKLILAGDGEMRPELESLLDKFEMRDYVRITGWISSDQVRDEILSSRALVLPSFAEGLPVVIMESMALHRPVLSTYVAGIPELVIPGENGWLFPAGSVDALVGAISQCLSTPVDTLRAMGESGHKRVVERHNIDVEVGKLKALFEASIGS
jgi:colanic acid/amylovoran biosynthesis glycosyltransferase